MYRRMNSSKCFSVGRRVKFGKTSFFTSSRRLSPSDDFRRRRTPDLRRREDDSMFSSFVPHLTSFSSPFSSFRKVEDLQFRVEEECITKGDLEVFIHITNTYELFQYYNNCTCTWGESSVAMNITNPEAAEKTDTSFWTSD